MLIDTHCHLHDREFFPAELAEDMIKNAFEVGVDKIICIGTSNQDSLAAQKFAANHKNTYWTYGIHPGNADESMLATSPDLTSCVAIGEVGLDYHYEGYDRAAQIKLFEKMLQLAQDHDLPLSFHVREAFDDFLPIVANFPGLRGVVHSFTDSKKKLKKILSETDFYIGVNGLATYSTLPLPPLERILLETDAPFLAPTPHRGKINQPAYIADIAKWLASKLAISPEQIAQITTANATTLFRL